MVIPVGIYGASGFGREVAWLVESCTIPGRKYQVVCFIDDDETKHGGMLKEIPVISLPRAKNDFPDAVVAFGVGNPRAREIVAHKAASVGFSAETIIHPRVERSKWIDIGEGSIICAGSILTTNIALGRHVHINLDCTIGHDVFRRIYHPLSWSPYFRMGSSGQAGLWGVIPMC